MEIRQKKTGTLMSRFSCSVKVIYNQFSLLVETSFYFLTIPKLTPFKYGNQYWGYETILWFCPKSPYISETVYL